GCSPGFGAACRAVLGGGGAIALPSMRGGAVEVRPFAGLVSSRALAPGGRAARGVIFLGAGSGLRFRLSGKGLYQLGFGLLLLRFLLAEVVGGGGQSYLNVGGCH